jgi:RNA polymerase sigma-70 factor, ECF subfamily
LRAGNPDAFRLSYERYKGDVIALAAAMLGRQDGALDVLHNVFVSFARQARSLAPDSNVRAYLLTAAANRARDHLKKRRETSTAWDSAAVVPCPKSGEPLELMAKEEQADQLRQALVTLPEDQRIVVALHVYGGLSFKKIAEVEGIPENTVASRYRYAIEKLRRQHVGADQ